MGAKPGRNVACPCGSGKKYKHCCLEREESSELARLRLRRIEGHLIPEVLRYSVESYGQDLLHDAWGEFWIWDDVPPLAPDCPEFETIFLPWFVFNWVADPDEETAKADWPREPLALDLVKRHPEKVDSLEERFAREAARRPFSFYSVEDFVRGRSLRLRDVLSGAELNVLERSGTESMRRGAILFARVVSLDGDAIALGCAPLMIPPIHIGRIIALREDIAATGRTLDDQALAEYAIEIRNLYLEIADEIRSPRLPQLANTDGEPLVPTTLYFELLASPAEAFEKLQSLSPGSTREELLSEARRDEAGDLRSVTLHWLRKGKREHKGLEDTILARIDIDGDRLATFVNSSRRAKAVREEIESRLGDRVCFRTAKIESLEKALEERRNRPETAKERRSREENARLNALPEVQERLREMAAAHWKAWVDEKIPALDHQTPREAATTPAGRERLEALLRDFEWKSADHPSSPLRADVRRLRDELGI